MGRWPWQRDDSDAVTSDDGDDSDAVTSDDGDDSIDPPGGIDVEPVVTCGFQDGTIFVYDDHVHLERDNRSRFDHRSIPMDEITDVVYEKGLTIGYLQIRQSGFESDEAGFLSDPVDANTLHFQRNKRSCAKRARDAIRDRITDAGRVTE